MKKYLDRLPRELKNLIYRVSAMAGATNIQVYLVGGFVRDLILGVKNFDLDIVAEEGGIEFAEKLGNDLDAGVIRHRRFKTATLILRQGLKIDIATARRESYRHPASLPEVSPGNLADDLKRRDFTINAMAISLNRNNFGKLIDFFGGKDDLGNRKIRTLHALSFIDDPTRILRAVRFEKRYNFQIEAQTLKRLKEAARARMLLEVQPQRLRDELILILKEDTPLKPIKRMSGLTGFDFLSRGLKLNASAYRLLESVDREIRWFRKAHRYRRQLDSWLVYFMALVDCLSMAKVGLISSRFALRRGEAVRLLAAKKIKGKFIRKLNQPQLKPSEIVRLLQPLSYETIILLKAKFRNKNIQRHIQNFLGIYNDLRIHISGDDLRALGITPGPDYQKIFSKVLKAKLDGKLKTKLDELTLIRRLEKAKGGGLK